MTESIFSALYKYRESENKSQLENYLTESLVNLLNRMEKQDVIDFIRNCLFMGNYKRECFLEFVNQLDNMNTFTWITQYSIKYGKNFKYPDIVLLGEHKPVMIIENKIRARFTTHHEEVDDSQVTEKLKNQLEIYGDWLSRQNQNSALILLTYATPPPSDYLIKDELYKTSLRSISYWHTIHKWFKYWGNRNIENNFCGYLAIEFALFLEDKGMNDFMNKDLAILNLFFSNEINSKLNNLMENARNVVQNIIGGCTKKPQQKVIYDDEDEILSDYCHYLVKDWYLQWGLWFPTGDKEDHWLAYGASPYPQAFILFASDKDDIPSLHKIIENRRKRSWYTSMNPEECTECVKLLNITELIADPNGFNSSFLAWLEKSVIEAKEIMELAAKQYKK